MLKHLRALVLALLIPLWTAPVAEARVKVVATLPSLASIAQTVGGAEVEVVALASPDQDPHYVDPRPSLVLALNKADLLVLNGLELEDSWLLPLLSNARNPNINVGAKGWVDASTFVPHLQQVPTVKIDRAMGDLHPGGNPHFLTDPRAGKAVALGLAGRLAAIDPAHQAAFQANAQALAAQLDQLAAAQTARFAALTPAQRKVVAYHQSFPYLFDWLGLTQVDTIEPRPGIPPAPDRIATVLGTLRTSGAKVIVQEIYQPRNISETLAKMAPATLVVLPGGVDFEHHEAYVDHLKKVAEALYAAIGR